MCGDNDALPDLVAQGPVVMEEIEEAADPDFARTAQVPQPLEIDALTDFCISIGPTLRIPLDI